MMHTRRSLLTFGALMAAVMLLLPAMAQAQPADPTALTLDDEAWDSIAVMWEWVGVGSPVVDAEKFEVVYEQIDGTTTAFTAGTSMSKSVNHDDAEQRTDNEYATTLSDLEPGKRYVIAVRSLDEDGSRSDLTDPTANTNSGVTETLAAPLPERVSGIMVEAGDKMLTVEWSPTYPTTGSEMGLSTVEYHLQYATSQTADASAGDWTPEEDGGMTIMSGTEATIPNLMNGTSYDVRIRAENNAGGKGEYSRVTEDTRGTPTAPEPDPDPDPLDAPMVTLGTVTHDSIMVSWGAVEGNENYNVNWQAAGGAHSLFNVGMDTEYTITGLMPGTMYNVWVCANAEDRMYACSDGMDVTTMPEPTPTPALPLFGVLALGAGLAAAGRNRLRARRLLKK